MKELLIPPKGMYTQSRSIDKCALSRKCFFSLRIPTYHTALVLNKFQLITKQNAP